MRNAQSGCNEGNLRIQSDFVDGDLLVCHRCVGVENTAAGYQVNYQPDK